MCGRYASSSPPGDLVGEYEVDLDHTDRPARSVLAAPQSPPAGQPDYNMAPTKQARVVLTRAPRAQAIDDSYSDSDPDSASAHPGAGRSRGGSEVGHGAPSPPRLLTLLTWGLVPSWAKSASVGSRMINARAESMLDKGAFTRAALHRRALVPADGWYEWQRSPTATDRRGKPRRQPFFVRRTDHAPLAFAALYEFWRDPAVDREDPLAWLTTFCIVTTAAEPGLDRIHDRQPVVLDPAVWSQWLDPQMQSADRVRELVHSDGPGRFEAWPVSTAVNATANNGPELLEPAALQTLDGVVDPQTGEILGQAS